MQQPIGYSSDDKLNSAITPTRKTGYIDPHAGNIGIMSAGTPMHMERMRFENRLAEVRTTLLGAEEAVYALKKDPYFDEPTQAEDRANLYEALENILMSYRHIEDARMRLGKVFRALNDGRSILPR